MCSFPLNLCSHCYLAFLQLSESPCSYILSDAKPLAHFCGFHNWDLGFWDEKCWLLSLR
jgi:hypothetical protein